MSNEKRQFGQSDIQYVILSLVIVSLIISSTSLISLLTESEVGREGPEEPTGEPIKIGVLNPMTGAIPRFGHCMRKGALLAIEDINEGNTPIDIGPGVLGRPLKPVLMDSGCNPSMAVKKLTKLKYQKDVDLVVGICSSGVAKACIPKLRELNTLLYGVSDSSSNLVYELHKGRSRKNGVPLFFVPDQDDVFPAGAQGAHIIAEKFKNAEAVIGLCPNYTYGYNTWESTKSELNKLMDEGTIPEMDLVEPIYHGLGARNFTPIITKLKNRAEKQDLVLFSSTYIGDLKTFFKQAQGSGLFEKLSGSVFINATSDELKVLEKPAPPHIWGRAECYNVLYPDTPQMDNWVERYRSRFGEMPVTYSMQAYTQVLQLAQAIEKANSTKPHLVAKATEGLEMDLPWSGRIRVRRINHAGVPSHSVYGKVGWCPELDQVFYKPGTISSTSGKELIRSAEEIKSLRENEDIPPGPYD